MLYDFAIIGGGSTGYAAAMYAGRLSLKTVLFAGGIPGGLIITTDIVENYPGFKRVSGFDIFENIREHAREYHPDEIEQDVVRLERDAKANEFIIYTKDAATRAKTVLFATGAKYRKLSVPGAKKFENKGVHYCALCDGFAYKEKTVAIIGGSDSAAKEALELAQNAKSVYIIYRGDEIHPEPINGKRVAENNKIEIINRTNVIKIIGEGKVEGVELDAAFNGSNILQLDGVFVAIGTLPQSALAEPIGVLVNSKKEIIINRYAETNIRGAYAAGDVVDTEFKQLITGCAEGVLAAYKAYEYVEGGQDGGL